MRSEFRAEAIKLVLEQGFSVVEAAARLNMNQGPLAYWVTQARKAGKTAPPRQERPGFVERGEMETSASWPDPAFGSRQPVLFAWLSQVA